MTERYEPCSIATVVPQDGAPVVQVSGEVDLQTVPALEKAITAAAQPGSGIVIDLARVSFLDSSGVTALVRAARDHRLVVRSPSEVVREVLDMAGLTDTLRIES